MQTRIVALLALLLVASQPALAAPLREVSQAEVRRHVDSGRSKPLRAILDHVGKSLGGKTLDVRAFADDQLYYRVVVMQPNGRIVSVVVNAETGQMVGRNSRAAKAISAQVSAGKRSAGTAASAKAGGGSASASGQGSKGSSGSGGGRGNGNGNGSGGGNGGGSGGGNGNGGGGGNGGGSGGSNGGGGNGNGGGNGGGGGNGKK